MCMKYLNKEWFLFNDEEVYSVKLSTFPKNIYMAFFWQTATLGLAGIQGWDRSHVKNLAPHELKGMLGLIAPIPKLKGSAKKPKKSIAINEAKYVDPHKAVHSPPKS